MKILYKFPSRSRPEKMLATIENIMSFAKHDDYEIMLTLDIDDKTCTTHFIKDTLKSLHRVRALYGRSTGKINAINRDMGLSGEWDILILVSDDMEFIELGFDLEIISDMPASLDAVIHYPDGHEHGDILSLPVMGRVYFDRLGYIYNPVYQSLFCDEEAIHVARQMGKLISSPRNIVNHNHPAWGKATWDRQYRSTEALYPVDKRIFLRRQKLRFPVKTFLPI